MRIGEDMEVRGGDVAGFETDNIYRVNLEILAKLVGCTGIDELLLGIRQNETGQAQFDFEEDDRLNIRDAKRLFHSPPKVRKALITAASRPKELDAEGLPKQLLTVGGSTGMTMIEVVLFALIRAGIEEVVIVTGLYGNKIVDHLNRSKLTESIRISYIELGDEFKLGHGHSILRAR